MHGQNCNYLKFYVPSLSEKRKPVRPYPGVWFRHVDKATRFAEGTSAETATVRRVVHHRMTDESCGRSLYKENETLSKLKIDQHSFMN